MSMSILNSDQSPGKAPLPPISTGRVFLLIILGLVVFSACAAIGLRVFPGPYRDVHYLIIGTVAVVISLLIIFLALLSNRRKMFVAPDDQAIS